MITQNDLRIYQGLKAEAAAIEKLLTEAKAAFIEEYPQGVEAGPYRIKIDTRESQTFSYLKLVDICGLETADQIKARVAPVVSTFVTVTGP